MTNISFEFDAVFKKFPTISVEARKIASALSAQEAGNSLEAGFLTYAFACHNLIAKSATLRGVHKDLDAALQGLADRVRAAYAKMAPSEFLNALRANDVKSIAKILKISDLHNKRMRNGELPLHYAIRCGSSDVVKYLLDTLRVNPLSKDHQGLTAFDHAFLTGNRIMISLVLGAALGIPLPEQALNNPFSFDEVQSLKRELTLLRGPQISRLNSLHYAALMGDIDALEEGAKGSDLQSKDSKGMTPLHYAALSGKEDAVKWLMKKGAKLDIKANGMDLLHFAAISGSEAVLKILLDTKKLDPNAADEKGRTPLHFAIIGDHLEAARLLVDHKADPLVQSESMKTTPLAILRTFSEVRALQRDPLQLRPIELATLGLFAASAVFRYFGWQGANFLSGAPVFGVLSEASNSRSQLLSIPGRIGFFSAVIGQLQGHSMTQSVCQGLLTASLGKKLIDTLRIGWKNSALESYRPIRNLFLQTANTLFSAWAFMQTPEAIDIKKGLVCKFGSKMQCLDQDELNPTCPAFSDKEKHLEKELNLVMKGIEKRCEKEKNPDVCVAMRIAEKRQEDTLAYLEKSIESQICGTPAKTTCTAKYKNDKTARNKCIKENTASCMELNKDNMPQYITNTKEWMANCVNAALKDVERISGCGSQGSDTKTVQQSLRKLASEFHPDKCSKDGLPKEQCERIYSKIDIAKKFFEQWSEGNKLDLNFALIPYSPKKV